MAAHARLAPSGAHRWIPCPGSVNMSAGLLKWTSEYATLGSAAHLVLDNAMTLEMDPRQWLGEMIAIPTEQGGTNVHEVTEDMTDAVGHAIDFVKGYLAQRPHAKLLADLRVNPGKTMNRDDCWGTLDLALDNQPIELAIIDYKHGAGIYVEVENNEQLLTYAVGYVADYYSPIALLFPKGPVQQVRLVIVQPRNRGSAGPVREHVVSWRELRDFATKLSAAAHETDKPDARLEAGDHCRFCPAAGRCPELARYSLELAQKDFDHEGTRLLRPDSAEFADLLRKAPIVVKWAEAISAEATRYALEGGRVKDFKLVRGRSNRFWRDQTRVKETLVADGYGEDQFAPRELLSPNKVEELYKSAKRTKEFRAKLAPLTDKAPGSLQLAPESDPRPDASPASQFDVEDGLLS